MNEFFVGAMGNPNLFFLFAYLTGIFLFFFSRGLPEFNQYFSYTMYKCIAAASYYLVSGSHS